MKSNVLNIKYIYTKIDGMPKFLIMDKCNFCPFLINDHINSTTLCGKYTDVKSKSKEKNYLAKIHGYVIRKTPYNRREPITDIKIPNWCELPRVVTKVKTDEIFYYKKNGILTQESSIKYANTISVVSSKNIRTSSIDGESLLTKPISSGSGRPYGYTPGTSGSKPKVTVIIDNTCSVCGKAKDTVNRSKNNGTCSECWENIKDTPDMVYKSYINNFRLKRKKSWVDKEFKKV